MVFVNFFFKNLLTSNSVFFRIPSLGGIRHPGASDMRCTGRFPIRFSPGCGAPCGQNTECLAPGEIFLCSTKSVERRPPERWSLCVSFSGIVLAQTTGTILGTVRDSSGAVVPNAKIEARNDAITLVRQAVTDANGAYVIQVLPVGRYVITAVAPGFAQVRTSAITLELNQAARIDLVLQVSKEERVLNVNAEAPMVDTTTAAIGEVVNSTQVVELPLNGRNFLQLSTLQAGVTPATIEYTPSSGSKLLNQLAGTTAQVNGLRIQSNNYLLDGADNNEPFYGFISAVPDPDTIEEDFLRNDIFDARNYFAPKVSPLKQNQFGGSLGGPIVKNKIFFFFNYQGSRRREGITVNTGVPSELERAGNFSQSANPPHDPATGLLFPNNIIPPDRINSINQGLLLKYFPHATSGQNQYVSSPSGPTNGDQFTVKVDQNIGKNDKMEYSFHRNNLSLNDPTPQTFFGIIGIPGFGTSDSDLAYRAVLSETHTFGTSAVNIARFAFNRTELDSGIPLTKTNRFDAGFTYPSRNVNDLAIIGITGYSPFGLTNAAYFTRTDNTFEWTDDFAKTVGRHTLKMGVDVRRLRLINEAIAFDSGGFSYAGTFSGNALGDFLLGNPLYFLQFSGNLRRYWFFKNVFSYFQDDIRVNSRFTLNVGLRWELFSVPRELHDRIIAFRPGETSTVNPDYPKGLLVVGDPGITKSTINTRWTDFAPRIGFSWDPFGKGKTTVRSGYGIFNDNVVGFTPFQLSLYPGITLITNVFAPASVADPFLGNSPFAGTGPLPYTGVNQYNPLAPNFRTPYAHQWNLALQHEVGQNLMFQAAYVGTKGTHLVGTHELNPALYVAGDTTATNVQQRRRYPQFGNLFENDTIFNSTYHSLQLTAKRRFSGGLQFLAAYTWSKTIDDVSVLHPYNSARGQSPFAQNPDCPLACEKGLAAFDVRHRFVVSYTWALPWLQNRKWSGRAFGNWTATGILAAQSGTPFTVLDSANPSLNGSGGTSDRTNLVAGCSLSRPSGVSETAEFFNTSCLTPIPIGAGLYGNAGRNILIGPGLFNVDTGFFKEFPIDEVRRFQFRFEVFNLFNHTNFALPDNDIRSLTFGQILNTLPSNERKLQFAFKFYF